MARDLVYGAVALVCAALLSFTATPLVRVLSYKIHAVDVPRDGRRMHRDAVPLIGGLAIFISFVATYFFFAKPDRAFLFYLAGAVLIVALGIADDVFTLKPWVKLLGQAAAALIPVLGGTRITWIMLANHRIEFGPFAVPLTLLWIVGLTNAINLIDGLDGLSCGVSTISCVSILAVLILQGSDSASVMMVLILIGACLGFLPYNRHPAKIFMGDTGAMFLGYTMAVISVGGMFKLHTAFSVIIPLIIFALPLGDTLFAFVRRLVAGKSPFTADRGHLHHRLVDLGFTQTETVRILYSICGILGLVAVFFCDKMFGAGRFVKAAAIAAIAILFFALYIIVLRNPEAKARLGLHTGGGVNREGELSDGGNSEK